MKYKSSQYDRSPCSGLGTAGNVCPAILLPCILVPAGAGLGAPPSTGCSVMPIGGVGFNPSFTLLQPSRVTTLLTAWSTSRASSQPYFVVLDRYQDHNSKVDCRNPAIHAKTVDSPASTRVMIMDKYLNILHRVIIRSQGCVSGRFRVVDARLFSYQDQMFVVYANFWPDCTGKKAGYWISPLHIGRTKKEQSNRRGEDSPKVLNATLKCTVDQGGMQELVAPRNGGLLMRKDGSVFELSDIAPVTTLYRLNVNLRDWHCSHYQVSTTAVRNPSPTSFSPELHNSINPLWIDEIESWLGVGHLHYLPRGKAAGAFQWGSSYRHVFSLWTP